MSEYLMHNVEYIQFYEFPIYKCLQIQIRLVYISFFWRVISIILVVVK